MIKKILFVFVSVLVFVSCSNNTTSPNGSNNGYNSGVTPQEEELIKKYGIDISQSNAEISDQIAKNLKAYFEETGSYRLIFTGHPKEYLDSDTTLYRIIVTSINNKFPLRNVTMDIDLRNVIFENRALVYRMFCNFDSDQVNNPTYLFFNYILPEDKITIIEDVAFFKDFHMRKISIPASVKSIGDEAFYYSPYLSTIIYYGDYPNNIKHLNNLFKRCDRLKTLIVPNAKNPDDPDWKTFLGYNFTTVTTNLE